ncbi:endolytic transglycosylase MltG [Fusibacter bizertensis]|uniref:Endolytic murein transglycosylase n=1 Tax=Fusibacter bizertensis TaxID=1488331 RepID=A0ABT6N9J5_9FIRM|nr:endolytic transglycosylase MltG [Fusibacter bizertensis]MDH8677092.1 endolytic transglycosylase MltG [Fusibacter bizertensis]
MKKLALLLLLVLTLSHVSGCAGVLEKYNSPVDPEDTATVMYTVPSGATTTSIGKALAEIELIQNANAFKAKAKQMEVDGQMKAGDYMLSKSMSTEEIITKLVNGDIYVEIETFTIPEGYEVRQIVDKLEAGGFIDREKFLDVLQNTEFDYAFLEGVDRSYLLEGYLFPDTYTLKAGATEVQIVDRMLERFDEIFTDEYYERAKELDMTVDQVITLASVIEREARVEEEFPIVSSVFHNRIDIGMMLQSCATVQFILKERKDVLSFDDIAIDSPYNTYINAGLTPSPIASPGELAIHSALYPADTNYLYFVTKETNDGSHYFNETLEGHNRDAARSH